MRKNRQNMRKTRQNHENPGWSQKLKVPKWVCRSPLASFCNGPPFFAIFGPARGQIFRKTAEKIAKNRWKIAFLCFFEGFNFLDSGISKFSRRRPMPAFSPVAFQQEAAFCTPINPIFGRASGQIFSKKAEKIQKIDRFFLFFVKKRDIRTDGQEQTT